MKLNNHFWYFKSAVPPRLCDEIINYALLKKDHMGRTGGVKDEKLSNKQIKDIKYRRDSNVVWLNDPWIYKELHPYIHKANKNAGWNFQWDTSEQLQFTKYKLNQYYDWHQDSFNKPFDKPNTLDHGKIRKLSMTCQLTDSSEYEGGELEFDFRDYDPPQRDEAKHLIQAKQILSKGSIIVFPSFVWHRVKPVRKGVRYSLVMWNLGYPFK
tara:strand:- start:160 stop:792 length:633 start_codon:yes stop_codon:yes gene_type:complete